MRERTVATTWGKTRIEALSDGVFAVAIVCRRIGRRRYTRVSDAAVPL